MRGTRRTPNGRWRISCSWPAVRHSLSDGGRVVVLATCFQGATPTNLLNYRKRQLVIDAFAWLGGAAAIPVRTDSAVNVLLFANEDEAGSRLLVHATQLSCDACETLSFVVAPPYCGGSVEVLEKGEWKRLADAWRDGRLVIPRTLHLYDTLAVKISLASGSSAQGRIEE